MASSTYNQARAAQRRVSGCGRGSLRQNHCRRRKWCTASGVRVGCHCRDRSYGHGTFSFFLRPNQSAQVIAVQDIGKIVATIFGDTDRFAGRTIGISGDEVTGHDLQEALSEAAGRPIAYHRFPDALLESNPFLGRIAKLFDDGRAAGSTDIAGR